MNANNKRGKKTNSFKVLAKNKNSTNTPKLLPDKPTGFSGIIQISQSHSPLPNPQDIKHYREISSDKINWEQELLKEVRQRRSLRNKEIGLQSKGLWFAFIIALVAIIGAILLIYMEKRISGGILGTATILGLVSAFIWGTKKRKNHS